MDRKILAFIAVFAIAFSGAACMFAPDTDGTVVGDMASDAVTNEEKTTTDDISWVAWLIVVLCIVEIVALAAFVYYRINKP